MKMLFERYSLDDPRLYQAKKPSLLGNVFLILFVFLAFMGYVLSGIFEKRKH